MALLPQQGLSVQSQGSWTSKMRARACCTCRNSLAWCAVSRHWTQGELQAVKTPQVHTIRRSVGMWPTAGRSSLHSRGDSALVGGALASGRGTQLGHRHRGLLVAMGGTPCQTKRSRAAPPGVRRRRVAGRVVAKSGRKSLACSVRCGMPFDLTRETGPSGNADGTRPDRNIGISRASSLGKPLRRTATHGFGWHAHW